MLTDVFAVVLTVVPAVVLRLVSDVSDVCSPVRDVVTAGIFAVDCGSGVVRVTAAPESEGEDSAVCCVCSVLLPESSDLVVSAGCTASAGSVLS